MSALELRLALSVRATALGIKIQTAQQIPGGWVATTEDFDADCVGDPLRYVATAPIGAGFSEDAAIEDLLDQVEARA